MRHSWATLNLPGGWYIGRISWQTRATACFWPRCQCSHRIHRLSGKTVHVVRAGHDLKRKTFRLEQVCDFAIPTWAPDGRGCLLRFFFSVAPGHEGLNLSPRRSSCDFVFFSHWWMRPHESQKLRRICPAHWITQRIVASNKSVVFLVGYICWRCLCETGQGRIGLQGKKWSVCHGKRRIWVSVLGEFLGRADHQAEQAWTTATRLTGKVWCTDLVHFFERQGRSRWRRVRRQTRRQLMMQVEGSEVAQRDIMAMRQQW